MIIGAVIHHQPQGNLMSRAQKRRISMGAKIATHVGQYAAFETARQQQPTPEQITTIQSLLEEMLSDQRSKALKNRELENEQINRLGSMQNSSANNEASLNIMPQSGRRSDYNQASQYTEAEEKDAAVQYLE